MVYAVRERKCSGCTTIVKGRIPPTGDVWCIECAVGRAEKAAMEMHNKSGEAYDRWLQTRGPRGRPRNDPG